MQILDNLIIILLPITTFVLGMKLANSFNQKMQQEIKDALQQQYIRLRANVDADDPCKPYGKAQYIKPVKLNTGDFDGDPITPQFMNHLRENGRATTKLKKSVDPKATA